MGKIIRMKKNRIFWDKKEDLIKYLIILFEGFFSSWGYFVTTIEEEKKSNYIIKTRFYINY
jgi:hypothetical protein